MSGIESLNLVIKKVEADINEHYDRMEYHQKYIDKYKIELIANVELLAILKGKFNEQS